MGIYDCEAMRCYLCQTEIHDPDWRLIHDPAAGDVAVCPSCYVAFMPQNETEAFGAFSFRDRVAPAADAARAEPDLTRGISIGPMEDDELLQ